MPRKRPPSRRTYSWTSSAAFFSQLSINESTRVRLLRAGHGSPSSAVAQAFDVVAEGRGLLEIEIRRGRAHLLLQRRDVGVELRLRAEHVRAVAGRHAGVM